MRPVRTPAPRLRAVTGSGGGARALLPLYGTGILPRQMPAGVGESGVWGGYLKLPHSLSAVRRRGDVPTSLLARNGASRNTLTRNGASRETLTGATKSGPLVSCAISPLVPCPPRHPLHSSAPNPLQRQHPPPPLRMSPPLVDPTQGASLPCGRNTGSAAHMGAVPAALGYSQGTGWGQGGCEQGWGVGHSATLPRIRDIPHLPFLPSLAPALTPLCASASSPSPLTHPLVCSASRDSISSGSGSPSSSSASQGPLGLFKGWGSMGSAAPELPEIVQAGDPVLHEPTQEVPLESIGSQDLERTINQMVAVMRAAPGVGLSANQIGVPLRIIVLEDTEEYMRYSDAAEVKAQQREAFPLLVIINPVLKPVGEKTVRFFEGCLSVDGYRGMVERHLEVEVSGLSRTGEPIQFRASGWKARILQHEYDHLQGFLYVDRLVPRSFRSTENLRLPLPATCPKVGPA